MFYGEIWLIITELSPATPSYPEHCPTADDSVEPILQCWLPSRVVLMSSKNVNK